MLPRTWCLVLCLAICVLSTGDNPEDQVLLRDALSSFFTTDQEPENFRGILSGQPFNHLFRSHTVENSIVCFLCNTVFDLLIAKRALNGSRESFATELALVCTLLNIEPERVCRGAVENYIDIILYYFDTHPKATSDRICGLLLQSFECKIDDEIEWSIDIAPGVSRERPTSRQTGSFTVLQLTDFHYDPGYVPGGNADCGEPICCQEDQGEPASSDKACGYWTDYRDADPPWYLVEETIKQAKTQDFDYVYFTGDVINHRMWNTSRESNSQVLVKTFKYLKETFDVPVFPIFGNHEPHPLDQWPSQSEGQFSVKWLYELVADLWSDMIGENVTETVLKGGYYSVSPRPGFRVIGINSNPGYTFNFWLLVEDFDPFGQLQWLADNLKQAEDNNESVHILMHATTGASTQLKVWSREYARIVERFQNTITGQFNGHTHLDEFHVYYSEKNPRRAVGAAFNGASVTPFVHVNPSFKYYYVDSSSFSLLDYDEWTFNLSLANSQQSQPLEWYKLYSFTDAYGAANLLPSEVDKVVHRMAKNHSLIDKYFIFKSRNADPSIQSGCDESCRKEILCDVVTTVYKNDKQCNYFLDLYNESSWSLLSYVWELLQKLLRLFGL